MGRKFFRQAGNIAWIVKPKSNQINWRHKMMKDPEFEQIRNIVIEIDNYCFGEPAKNKIDGITFKIGKENIEFTLHADISRREPHDHTKKDIKEILAVAKNLKLKNVIIVEKTPLMLAIIVSAKTPATAELNKFFEDLVTSDLTKRYLNNYEVGDQIACYYLGPVRGLPAQKKSIKLAANRRGMGLDPRAYVLKR